MTTRTRRAAGTPAVWGELTTEDHGGRPVTFAWPWDSSSSVTVTFLERGEMLGTVEREVTPAVVDDDTGETLEPAVTETVERWMHTAEHPEWGRNSFEFDADHPVTVGDAA
jgi:hypothetical protein